ncbi:MAG: DUF3107 domain-containing protein [Mycobacterium sp.]
MEVKIGVSDSPRELVFNSPDTPEQVEHHIRAAIAEGENAILSLTDDKGKRLLVQTAKIAYVEIGAADARRVGFGVASPS